jgi:eukaryotic-like serine/threonine-protein kinase
VSSAKTIVSKVAFPSEEAADAFERALALEGKEREAFLQALSPEMREEVRSLVDAHVRADGFLAKPSRSQILSSLFSAPSLPRFQAGERLEDFEILRPIGEGGLARVYLAKQISLGREVALKISRNSGREARLMAGLEHDHIVKVFSEFVDVPRDLRILCMQYVPGTTLDQVITRLAGLPKEGLSGATLLEIVDSLVTDSVEFHPASLQFRDTLAHFDFTETVLFMGARLADTLEYAHQKDILHLDVKPANILFNPYGRFLLSDFNISFSKADVEATKQQLGGTPDFMSPEQEALFTAKDREAAIAKLDRRSDVYALALVLRKLFETAGLHAEPKALWRAVLAKALQRDPEKRFATAADFASALRGALERYKIEKDLPRQSWISRLSFQFPLGALIAYGVVPQVLASVINILYNKLEIVSRLSAAQQAYFEKLMLYYNPVAYGLCVGLWVWQLKSIVPAVRRPPEDLGAQAELRLRLLRLPLWVTLITTLGWVPSAVLFPSFIHLQAGGLPLAAFGHFFVSFVFSWLIALGYSSLFIQFICVRVLYPRFFNLESNIRQLSRRELASVARYTTIFHRITSYVPLFGALFLHLYAAWDSDETRLGVLSMLSSLLILIGIGGNYLGSRRNNQLIQTLFAFMGQTPGMDRRSSARRAS